MDLKFQARLARRGLRRAVQTLRYGSLAASPVLFANSFPKSGTHLLTQVLQGFTRFGPAVDSGLPAVVTFDGFSGRQRSLDEILSDLGRLLPGDIGYGHLHALPQVVEALCRQGVAPYFILRDPRDVAVSHVHYIAEMAPNHIHYHYYHEILQNFDQRLEASICGVPAETLSKAAGKSVPEPLPDIRSRFEPFTAWLDQPQVLTLRFEDFITDRRAALLMVLDHAMRRGFQPATSAEIAIDILEKSNDPQRSPTFRTGKSGGWRAAFSQRHLELFHQTAGDLLERLGYEEVRAI
jgi:hypothetical protein